MFSARESAERATAKLAGLVGHLVMAAFVFANGLAELAATARLILGAVGPDIETCASEFVTFWAMGFISVIVLMGMITAGERHEVSWIDAQRCFTPMMKIELRFNSDKHVVD